MALGKRTAKQTELFVPVAQLPKSPAHPFYAKLNGLLAESAFDPYVEKLCEPYYKEGGRPSIPPGTYFRMLFIGYFEGIDSQRGIAWRCADSRSLREFLGAELTDATPAHNSMTVSRPRLPAGVAYKAEHAVDLESTAIVAAHVTTAERGDTATGEETLILAQVHLVRSGSQAEIKEVVQDKGYHDNKALARIAAWGVRTYVPERKQKSRVWTDKPAEFEAAFRANRRRVRSDKGRRLNRWRSEKCERSFAHVCETGGGRRLWLRGLDNATKSHLLRCASCNLGLILSKCYGMSKPRSAAVAASLFFLLGLFLTLGIIRLDLNPTPTIFWFWGVTVLFLSVLAGGLINRREPRMAEMGAS